MGNRAVIALESMPEVGIYLHWEGGQGSVLGFIEAAKQAGVCSPGSDESYAFAGLIATITRYMHDPNKHEALSVGVGPMDILDTDNGDNGLYWIADDWSIARRDHTSNTAHTPTELTGYDKEAYARIVGELTGFSPGPVPEAQTA